MWCCCLIRIFGCGGGIDCLVFVVPVSSGAVVVGCLVFVVHVPSLVVLVVVSFAVVVFVVWCLL